MINWLFPLPDGSPKLSSGLLYKFRTTPLLRIKVVQLVIRFIRLYGYEVSIIKKSTGIKLELEQKSIIRWDVDTYVGLYNEKSYPVINRIFKFLSEIRMPTLSALLFLMICRSLHDNIIKENCKEYILPWLRYQQYISENDMIKVYENLYEKLEEWEYIQQAKTIPDIHRPPPRSSDAWDEED